jgi:hypothetical protein
VLNDKPGFGEQRVSRGRWCRVLRSRWDGDPSRAAFAGRVRQSSASQATYSQPFQTCNAGDHPLRSRIHRLPHSRPGDAPLARLRSSAQRRSRRIRTRGSSPKHSYRSAGLRRGSDRCAPWATRPLSSGCGALARVPEMPRFGTPGGYPLQGIWGVPADSALCPNATLLASLGYRVLTEANPKRGRCELMGGVGVLRTDVVAPPGSVPARKAGSH